MADVRARIRAGIDAWAKNLTEQQLAGISLSDLETDLMAEIVDFKEPGWLAKQLEDPEFRRLYTAELGAAVGWQPIETAPKDGTWILACVPSDSQYNQENNAGYSWLPEVIHWGVYHPNSRGKEEWRNGDGVRRPHHSHWMPLPEPPEVSRG